MSTPVVENVSLVREKCLSALDGRTTGRLPHGTSGFETKQLFSSEGVTKLTGTLVGSEWIRFDPAHSVGADDTPMDNFLGGDGLAMHVDGIQLGFRVQSHTIQVSDSFEIRDVLFRLRDRRRLSLD